jgi:hypothetical protein
MGKMLIAGIALANTLAYSSVAFGDWSVEVARDRMTDNTEAYAHSSSVKSLDPMKPPYTGTKAWLGVGCDAQRTWTYVGFDKKINITKSRTGDGTSSYNMRIRLDNDQPIGVSTIHEWGGSFLHFEDDLNMIGKFQRGKKLLIEIGWYGQNRVYYEFDLTGSTGAIESAYTACGRSLAAEQDERVKKKEMNLTRDEFLHKFSVASAEVNLHSKTAKANFHNANTEYCQNEIKDDTTKQGCLEAVKIMKQNLR